MPAPCQLHATSPRSRLLVRRFLIIEQSRSALDRWTTQRGSRCIQSHDSQRSQHPSSHGQPCARRPARQASWQAGRPRARCFDASMRPTIPPSHHPTTATSHPTIPGARNPAPTNPAQHTAAHTHTDTTQHAPALTATKARRTRPGAECDLPPLPHQVIRNSNH